MSLPVVLVRQGSMYEPRYVEVLTKQVGAPVTTLTDMKDTPGKKRPLVCDFNGWTSKMELFAPWNRVLRPCLFFDLDTFVLGDISDIRAIKDDKLWLIRGFFQPRRSNSGIIVVPKNTDHIWAKFEKTPKHKFRDGDFLDRFRHNVLQDHFEGIVSYKADKCFAEPKGRIVCWHGKPKPHECDGWVKKVWQET